MKSNDIRAIYGLYDESDSCVYVGAAKNIKARFRQHIASGQRYSRGLARTRVSQWISDQLQRAGTINIKLIAEPTANWQWIESETITRMKGDGVALLNAQSSPAARTIADGLPKGMILDAVLEAMRETSVSTRTLSRFSGVPYQSLHSFLSRRSQVNSSHLERLLWAFGICLVCEGRPLTDVNPKPIQYYIEDGIQIPQPYFALAKPRPGKKDKGDQ